MFATTYPLYLQDIMYDGYSIYTLVLHFQKEIIAQFLSKSIYLSMIHEVVKIP